MKLTKKRSKNNQGGFTLTELLVVVVVLVILGALCLPALADGKQKAQRLACANNLKEVGAAYGRWKNDNGEKYPAQQAFTNGGWQDAPNAIPSNIGSFGAVEGPAAGTVTATGVVYNYILLRNELAQNTKLVACPADGRTAGLIFTNNFSKTNVSYFVGVGANDLYPHAIVGGDRNMGGWTAGYPQDSGYGFSEESLNTGNGADVVASMTTYGFMTTGGVQSFGTHVGWSAKLHSAGNVSGEGNILLGDGSGQQCSAVSLEQAYLSQAADTGNFQPGDTRTSPPYVRFCFP